MEAAAPPAPPPAQRRVRRRQNSAAVEKADANEALKVHVSGFPPYTQAGDLVRSFSQFGAAAVDRINGRQSYAYLLFETTQQALAAVQASNKINIYGEFLLVRPYNAKTDSKPQPKQNFIRSKQKDQIVDPAQLDLSGDFHAQMDAVLLNVRLSQQEACGVSRLYEDLERALQGQWPGCVVMPFGSITTGLGIKSSDADCYVQLVQRQQRPGSTLVARARQLLQNYPHIFTETLAIPRANTPIVKFFHLPTRTNCDLSFKTPLGAQNSRLIAFLLHLDPRLIPIAVVIKYWAKVHGLSGTGKLTNYALTMMIIFYLQRPPLCLLPSVESLQRDRAYDVIVDHWNTGFYSAAASPPSNTTPIAEILGGFFQFYANFNFEEDIVCPFLGEAQKKEAFKDLNALPQQFDRYKRNVTNGITPPIKFTSAMCVQDPFELCHNVASGVNARMAADIKAYFAFAADAFENDKANACRYFIKTILLQKPKIVRKKTPPEFRMMLFPRMILDIKAPDWKAVVRDAVMLVFENMLKIHLEKVQNADAKEKLSKERERYTGAITKAIWKRKQLSKMYNVMKMDFQTKQAKITEDIILYEKQVFDSKFQLTITMGDAPRTATVILKLLDGNYEAYYEFGKFFLSVVRNWFTEILRKHNPGTEPTAAETIQLLDDEDNDLDSDDDDDDDQPDLDSDDDSPAEKDMVNDKPADAP